MKTTILAAVVLAFGTVAVAQDKVTLKVKYEPGTSVLTISTDGTMNMISPQPMKQKIAMLIVMEMTSDKPAADSQTIHVTYKRFKMDMSSAMMNMNYDSADESQSDSPMAGTYKALLDKTIDVVLGPDGKVKDVKGLEKIWDAMGESNPMAAQMAEQMKKQFGKEMFTQMFDSAQKAMPSKPVGPGDTWTVSDKMPVPMIGQVDVKTDYKLKDVKGGVANIEMTGKISSDQAATQPAAGLPMKFDQFKATQTGTMKFDIAKGVTTDVKIDQKMNMQGTMGEGEQAQKMSMDMDQVVTTTVKPGKYAAPATRPAPKNE